MENREVNYACDIKRKKSNGEEDILYNCNRSDSRGFVSLCKKRRMKIGGSIRIHGMCPSRTKMKISKDGKVMVKFTETHVGHDDELRSKRLSGDEKNLLVGQLTADSSCVKEPEDLYINESSTNQLCHQNDIKQENSSMQDQGTSTLDTQEFEKLMSVFSKFKNDIEKWEQEIMCKKIKIEKQTYYRN